MVFFGVPPLSRRYDHSRDRLFIPLLANFVGDILRNLLLLCAVGENHTAVLGTDVGALPVEGGSVVHAVEEFEELAVRHHGRIKGQSESFSICGERYQSLANRIKMPCVSWQSLRVDLRPVLPLQIAR